LGIAAAHSQSLPDPTQPPFGPTSAGGAGAAATAPVSPLQSVILRPGARPRALIRGEWIELGQEYAGARLVKVTESSVTLKGPSGLETLYLTPNAEKKPVKTASTRRRGVEKREMK
jgi:hypothetical protein